MSSTSTQPTATESPPAIAPGTEGRQTDTRAPATFDTGCRRRLVCLIDAENQSISPAYSAHGG